MRSWKTALIAMTFTAVPMVAGAQARPIPLAHGEKAPVEQGTTPAPQPVAASKDLRVYFVDVEGGQATLFVAPGGESLLVDAGWPGERDAGRIVKAAKEAGLSKIDTVLITHYHTDHVGGVPALAAKIPIGRFLDHGPNRELDHGITEQGYAAYQKLLGDRKIPEQTVKAGDALDVLPGVKTYVLAGDGDLFSKTFTVARINPFCPTSPEKPEENSENDRSVGILLVFGRTRILDLGDLTWSKERRLVCPLDRIGRVDVYIASHHGFDRSGSPALVDTTAPRLAIIDNGGHKGADPAAWQIVASSMRMEQGNNLWQLHTAEAAGAHNVDPGRIANLASSSDSGYGLMLSVAPDATLSVTNQRTGDTKVYPLSAGSSAGRPADASPRPAAR